MEAKRPAESKVVLTQVMGPADANILGNVHGGFIMKLCDETGAMVAIKHARRPAVTVTVDSMTFHSPVKLGHLLTVSAELAWVGNTSMETRVVVSAENVITGEITHTNTAYIVYVALDENGKPVRVPPLALETEAERQRFARGEQRRKRRLQEARSERGQ